MNTSVEFLIDEFQRIQIGEADAGTASSLIEADVRIVETFLCEAPIGFGVATFQLEGRYVVISRSTVEKVTGYFLDEATFAQFGFHPFRFLACTAHQQVEREGPSTASTAIQLADFPPGRLGCIMDCALTGVPVALLGDHELEALISAVYDLVPPSCRRELSFNGLSTASTSVSFRLFAGRDETDLWRTFSRLENVSILRLHDDYVLAGSLRHPWSRLIVRLLQDCGYAECLSFVNSTTAETLNDLGRVAEASTTCREDVGTEVAADDLLGYCFSQDVLQSYANREATTDLGHQQNVSISKLDLSEHDVLEQLDQLDDAVFDAVAGVDDALGRLRELWPNIRSQLAPEIVDESRHQYVRLIVDRWTERLDSQGHLDGTTARPAMEVLRLLFSDPSST